MTDKDLQHRCCSNGKEHTWLYHKSKPYDEYYYYFKMCDDCYERKMNLPKHWDKKYFSKLNKELK